MHIAARYLLALWLTALAPAFGQDLPSAASPEQVGLSSVRLQRLDQVLNEYVQEGRIAGGVALILRDGKVAYHKPFGHLDSGKPMRTDAIFRIASMTKAITSVAVMMLNEEGQILLGDPVSKYIPEFKKTTVAVEQPGGGYSTVPANREITIRDLLTHTAGISYGDGVLEPAYKAARVQGWYFAGHDEPIGASIRRLAALPFRAHPGEKWVYGFATDILGHVVEQVSGVSLDEFFRTRIFEPLGMTDTHFYLPAEKLERFTPVYAAGEGEIKLREIPQESDYVKGPRKAFSGGAGLLSTASDYARFLQMLLNGGRLEGVRLLSPKTVQLMTADHVRELYANGGFGLGFRVVEDLGESGQLGSVGSFGWGGAYYTSFWVDPREKLVAVFMSQLLPNGGLDLQSKFNNLVYQSIIEPVPPAPHAPR